MYDNELDAFFYHKLSGWVGLHAIYFAMYLFLSIVIVDNYPNIFKINNISMVAIIKVFAYSMIFLLSSKIIWGIIMVYLVYKYLIKEFQQKNFKRLIFGALFICLFVVSLFNIPYTKKRIVETHLNKVSIENGEQNGISARLAIWKFSFDLIKVNPILGVGTGDSKKKLDEIYEVNNFNVGKDLSLNAHNQYIQTALEIGITGLLTLLILILIILKESLKSKNVVAITFVMVILICFITESTLNTQKGVVFFGFFSSLFYSKSLNNSLI